MQTLEKIKNLDNSNEGKNEIKLGSNCLFSGKRGGFSGKLKNFSKFSSENSKNANLSAAAKDVDSIFVTTTNDDYVSTIWESANKSKTVGFYTYEASKPLVFFTKAEDEECEFDSWQESVVLKSTLEGAQMIADEAMDVALHDAFTVHNYLAKRKKRIFKVVNSVLSKHTTKFEKFVDTFNVRWAKATGNGTSLEKFLKSNATDDRGIKFVATNEKKTNYTKIIKTSRQQRFYFSDIRRDFFRHAVRSDMYPKFDFAKKTVNRGYIARSKINTTASAYLKHHFARHPMTQFRQTWKHMLTTMNPSRLEKWKTKTRNFFDFSYFYKSIWRYFKFKIERYFHKKIGVRVHIWMMNVWDIFLSGIDSYWQWFKFEDQKLFALTRKGQRFLIERREDAKLYLRAMVLTLTFGGGVKLYIDKITEMVRQFRNNWAFITHSMESLRRCGNFFWFRFFLNYKVAFQGKIAGILRAEKKTFKKGEVTIEDRSTVIAYHRTFPQSKFGSYSLGFWLQYRVPNLIGTFNEMEYIDTMRILLSMYTIPWLSSRLTEIIEAILREKEIRDQLRFNQYNRRARGRALVSKEISRTKRVLKAKKKATKKRK